MCGIVGAVAQRDITPILIEGPKRLEYRGLRFARRRPCTWTATRGARVAPSAWRSCPSRSPRTSWRFHRHRPHALGHARHSCHLQRPPAFLGAGQGRAAHRAGAQRHHREPRRAAPGTAGRGLRVRKPDRHRGDRAPGQPSVRGRSVRGGAAGRAPPAGRLRHRRVLPRRAAPRGRGPARVRRWWSGWARTRTSWPPTRWPWPARPTRSSTWKTATWSICSWPACGSSTRPASRSSARCTRCR